MINRIYGILKGSVVIPKEVSGYRYTDARRTHKQNSQLSGLVPDDVNAAASFVNYVIQLLSCSPYWPTAIRELDPNNTYDIAPSNPATLPFSPMERLMNWEIAGAPVIHDRFKYSQEDPVIDRICAKLFAIIAAGVDDDSVQS